MKKIIIIFSMSLFIISGCVHLPETIHSPADIEFRGMSYTPWAENALLTPLSDKSLEITAALGCNWIALNVWMFQDDIYATEIDFDFSLYSASPKSIIHAIEKIHSLGMKVLLKPNIDNRSRTYRGKIKPSKAWFAEYKETFQYWADFAEENKVEMLSVGCELERTTAWTTQWEEVISMVKSRYSGLLTYSANHGNEQDIEFWGALDYIGIDAYYPLTNKKNPPFTELVSAWARHLKSIDRWLASTWPDKPVLFTELGYQSKDGANITPWSVKTKMVDMTEQADCYEALLSQAMDYDWWKGIFWWNWETNPAAGGVSNPDFTPQRKPAEDVLRKYYLGE